MKTSVLRKIGIVLFCIITVVLFILIYFVPSVSNIFATTALAEYDKVEITDDITGYIVRNETLYFAKKTGIVESFIPEGERARRGERIVQIISYEVEENEEMTAVRQKLYQFARGESVFANDLAKISNMISENEALLAKAKSRNNQEELREIEDRLSRLLLKKEVILQSADVIAENLKDTTQSQDERGEAYGQQEAQQETDSSVQTSAQQRSAEEPIDASGIISYYIDGYETEFTPTNMYMFNKEKVQQQEIHPVNAYQMGVKQGDPVFKLVKNSTWYVIAWIQNENVVKYKKGNNVRIQFAEYEVSGKIDDIAEADQNMLVIMKFNTYFPAVSQMRQIDVHVITLESMGLRINNKSITTQDDVPGVYVKNLEGKFDFMPIKLMKTDGEYSIVYSEYFDEQSTDGGIKRIKTIKPYDEILKNGEARGT